MTTDVTGSFRGGIGRVAGVLDWQSLEDISLAAQGLISQNFDRQLIQANTIMIDGTIYFMMVPFRAGTLITNLLIQISNAGTGMSVSKMGLYNLSGTQLAVTADLGTAWNSAGVKVNALTAAYTIVTNGGYYIAVLGKTATTMPTLARSTTAASNTSQQLGANPFPFGTLATQTDLPSTLTVTGVTNAIPFWVGAS